MRPIPAHQSTAMVVAFWLRNVGLLVLLVGLKYSLALAIAGFAVIGICTAGRLWLMFQGPIRR